MEKKTYKNITLDRNLTETYGNVDGLSIQNIFYANNGYFANCYTFRTSDRSDNNYLDSESFCKYIEKKYGEEHDFQSVKYVSEDISTGEERVSFSIIIKDLNLYGRFEKSITECYILYANDNIEDLMELVNDVKKYYIAPEAEKNNLYILGTTQMGYTLIKSKVKEIENFSTEEQYNDNFSKENEKISNFISEEGRSGLVILHGEKGTGKTTYIRHLINSYPERNFVSVPASLVTILGDPSFGSFLMGLANHVIILEDCENVIRDRNVSGSSSAVSLILNMTDGLLSDELGIKFICTFNEDIKNIDEALLRKGRLVSKYEFKPLCKEKANNLLDKIYGTGVYSTEKPLTLADIYNFEDDSYDNKKTSII